jgi:hypothetical protein
MKNRQQWQNMPIRHNLTGFKNLLGLQLGLIIQRFNKTNKNNKYIINFKQTTKV